MKKAYFMFTTSSSLYLDLFIVVYRAEVPNLGYMYPLGYICLSQG